MTIQRRFTIIELLVAIGLTAVLSNLLSTVYVRISQYSIQQAGTVSGFDSGSTIMGRISADLARIKIPSGMQSWGTNRDFRMMYKKVTMSGNSATNTTGQYPYFVFTVEREPTVDVFNAIASGNSDGFEEIGLLLAPPMEVTPATGIVDEKLLCIYRVVNSDLPLPGTSLFDETNLTIGSTNLISDQVLGMSMRFSQYNGFDGTTNTTDLWSVNTNSTANDLDTFLENFGSNDVNKVPDVLEMTVTISPGSGPFVLSNLSGGAISIGTGGTDFTISNDSGSGVLTYAYSFPLASKGHLVCPSTGKVFWFEKTTSTTITCYAMAAGGSSSIPENADVYMGISLSKRFVLQ